MDDYLAKPFDREELHRLLAMWCRPLLASGAASCSGLALAIPEQLALELLQRGAGRAVLPLQSTRNVTNMTMVSAAKPRMAPASSA